MKTFAPLVAAVVAGLFLWRYIAPKLAAANVNNLAAVGSPDAVKDNRATLPPVNAALLAQSNATLTDQATLPPT